MDRLIESNRAEIKRVAGLRGARRIRIFGSMARGDAGPERDVDILVDLKGGQYSTLIDIPV
jgi:hypothetical protein